MKRKHFLLIAALSISLTTTACAATLAACGDDDPALIELVPNVTGKYYFDDNGAEKTIELGLSSFTLDFGDGVKTGVYGSYENGTIVLDFDNSETATAVFKSGILTLNYNGRTYVMYLMSQFTVRFDVDGGSAVGSQRIVNGKKAARPESDPTRDNSVFIGWYKDSACVTPFDFDAEIITSDTTVYAKFIAINANFGVYKATFDLGEGVDESYPALETVNRVLYHLPELPSKDGNAFLGWWVSDYYDRAKLSAKYDGQELYEDTVLYAVWAGDAPAVSVTSAGASWTARGTNNSYSVVIKDAEGNELKRQSNASTSIAFDFGEAEAGDYTVEVTVNGNTAIAYYRNKSLARVTKFTVEGDYFGFAPIEAADKYLVVNYYMDLECGTPGHTHEGVRLSGNGFNFADCRMTETGLKFRITARADGYAESVSEVYTLLRGLEAVKNLDVDENTDTVSWDAVENVKHYILELSNGEETISENVTKTSYDLRSLAPGNWTVKVTPYNTTYNTPEATTKTYEKVRLASPVLSFNDTEITWAEVEGATGYRVFVNGVQQGDDLSAETRSFTVSQNEEDYVSGYAVTVIALGAETPANSLASDPLYVHGELGEITYANGKLTWEAVRGVTKFGVKVGDAEEFFVTVNEADVTFTKSGDTVIIVTAYVGDNTAAGTSEKRIEVYAVKFNTKSTAIPDQYKADGDIVTLPADPSRLGYEFLGWFNQAEGGTHLNAGDAKSFVFDSAYPTVYAHWQGNEYKVTLDAGEGTLPSGDPREITVVFGERNTAPYPVPELLNDSKGRVFMGWFTAPGTGGTQMTDNTGYASVNWNIADNTTLYAHWGSSGVKYVDDGSGKGYVALRDDTGISNLNTVTILAYYNGKPVTGIQADAFDGCSAVTKLRIPSSLRTVIILENGPTMRGSSFYGLTGLKEIEVYDVEGEKFFASYDGALYSVANGELDALLFVPKGKDVEGAVLRVADGAKRIAHHASYSMYELTEVIIPSSVVQIDDSAFQSNYKLSKLTFLPAPDGQMGEALTVGKAFNYCGSLTEVTFPKRLTSLSPEAFYSTYTGDSYKVIQNIFIQELGDKKDRNTNYYDLDGVLCKQDELVLYPIARGGSFTSLSGISKIGEGAFGGNKNLKSVKFISTIREIGVGAFKNCSELTSVSFDQHPNNGDLIIRDSAFYGCTGLESVILPPSLQTLEANAFGGNTSLTSVTVNSNRQKLDFADGAFTSTTGTSYVTDLVIGAGVQTLSISGVFGSKLQNVTVDPENPNYYSEDNVIYDKDITEILFFPDSKTEFTISDNLETISSGVFKGKTSLVSVTIGTGVKVIEDSAFEGCTALTTVVFKAGGTETLKIGNKAFFNCKAIATLEFNGRGGAEITIGDQAFAGGNVGVAQGAAIEELTLPEGVTTIGKFAFDSRGRITTFNLPASLKYMALLEVGDSYPSSKLTSIGVANVSVFRNCYPKEINVAEGSENFASVNGVLYGKEEGVVTTLYQIGRDSQGTKMPDEYKIAEYEGDDYEYGYLEIPETVTKIADFALYNNGSFKGEGGIRRIVFKGTHDSFTIGNSAFQYAYSLRYIDLPSGITEIPEALFNGCDFLKEVNIPNTVTTIKKKAFAGCKKLEKVTFAPGNDETPLVIEDGESISTSTSGPPSYSSSGAFYNCIALTEIKFPARLTSLGAYTFCVPTSNTANNLKTVEVPATIARIGDGAFESCKKLTGFKIAGTVTAESADLEIGSKAFYNCPLSEMETPFEIPSNVSVIGSNAFQGTGLTEITIPARVTELKALGITTLTTLKFATVTEDGKEVSKLTTMPISLCSGLKSLTSVELEKCTSLTAIPNKAFEKTGLTSVKIPAQVTSIGISAFDGSTNLSKVEFLTDDGGKSSVAEIGNYAFRNTNLKNFAFPTLAEGTITLGMNLFEGCANLTDLTISASVQDIGASLSQAPNLQNITVAEGAGVILDVTNRLILGWVSEANKTYKISSAFAAVPLDAAGTFKIPGTYGEGTIVEIGNSAFVGQNAVRTFSVPASIVSIGNQAFSQCRGLKTVEFAADGVLNHIGSQAFEYTYSLETLTLPNSLKEIGQKCFMNSGLTEITMPDVLEKVGRQLFYEARNLVTVKNLSKMTFTNSKDTVYGNLDGSQMFYNCVALKNVSFAEGADTLPDEAFQACSALEKIDLTGITTLAKYEAKESSGLFRDCAALEEIVFDARLTKLSAGMFYGCKSLTTIYRSDYLAQDAGKEENDTYRFKNRGIADLSQMTEITAKGNCTYEGTFRDCSSLKRVDIRNVTKFACADTFMNCTGLQKVTLAGATYTVLQKNMFQNCALLKTVNYWDGSKIVGEDNEVTLHNNINFLGVNTFQKSGIEKINVPQLVTMFGTTATAAATSRSSYLFDGCASLKTVVLPKGFTRIAAYVFRGCESLDTIQVRATDGTVTGENGKITLPESLVAIGNYSFQGCTALTSIDLSYVTEIGTTGTNTSGVPTAGLFFGCENLSEVTLNDNIEVLGCAMFAFCTNLKTITLPSKLKATNTFTFYGSGLTSITLPDGVKCLGSTTKTGTVSATANCGVFDHCENLQTITVSANFEKMGKWAFRNCSKLESFTIDGTNTKFVQVGQEAFLNCEKIASIDLSKVTTFGSKAFNGCTSLTEADLSSAGTLQVNMFDGCSALETVTLGSNVKTLPNYIFRGCTSLESIDLTNVTSIGSYAFSGCSVLKTVTLGAGLASVNTYAFADCTLLSTIYKSDTAEADRIADTADLSGLTSIGNYAFRNCKALAFVKLGEGLTEIGSDLFYNCSSLTTINLPSTLETINGEAFLNCSSLAALEIPASVATIGNNLFIGCSNLALTVAAGNEKYAVNADGWLVDKTDNTVLYVPRYKTGSDGQKTDITEFNFGAGTKLCSYMFNGYGEVTKITLPSDLTEIPYRAFWNFKGSFGTELVIPEGVTSIGAGAFMNCTGLTKITFPSTLTSIGNNAFEGCTNLREIVIPSNLPAPTEEYEGLTIGSGAFKNCTGLNGAMTLPGGIASIGANAFDGCTGLLGIAFGDHLKTVGNYAFAGCNALIGVSFRAGLTSIGQFAFAGCQNLQSVNIPYTVTKVDSGAFSKCPNLATVTFDATPEGTEEVALTFGAGSGSTSASTDDVRYYFDSLGVGYYGVFAGCTALKTIALPERATSISTHMFLGAGIESIEIPASITSIGNYAFMYSALKSISIPYTVVTIGSSAFGGCTELTSLTFEETPEGEEEKALTMSDGTTNAKIGAGYAYYDAKSEKYYSGAFVGAAKLQNVVLPKRLAKVGKYAFAFSGVKTADIGGVSTINDGAFYECLSLTDVLMPDGTVTIGSYVFQFCTALENVQIAATVTTVNSYAFDGCTSVAQIVLPVGAKCNNYAFNDWTKEQKVLIDVKGSEAFATATASLWTSAALVTDAVIGITGVDYSGGTAGNNA